MLYHNRLANRQLKFLSGWLLRAVYRLPSQLSHGRRPAVASSMMGPEWELNLHGT